MIRKVDISELKNLDQVLLDGSEAGKTVKEIVSLSYTQHAVIFDDGTYLCFTARIDDAKPWIATAVMAGCIEKEWR